MQIGLDHGRPRRNLPPMKPLADPFGRPITYLRLSVTDRCDLRCTYCMAETMQFLPRTDLLGLEELAEIAETAVSLGIRRIRLTGGEPLVRGDIMALVQRLARHLGRGLDELTLSTNGTHLARHAAALAAAGVRRLNVSLDTLDAARYARLTRHGRLSAAIAGIKAARAAGLAVRINTVALRGENESEFDALIAWCGARGCDLCLIETMPLGEIGADRTAQYLSLADVRAALARRWTLLPTTHRTAGPARYVRVAETGTHLGFITPLSCGFCDGCNRIRISAGGVLHPCLGQEDAIPLRPAMAEGRLAAAMRAAIAHKPRGHDFAIGTTATRRHMSATGG